MNNANTTLLLLISNLVLIMLIFIEKILAIDYFYLNALLVLLLIAAGLLLLFKRAYNMGFDMFLAILITIAFAFISLQKGYNIVFLMMALASAILFVIEVILFSEKRLRLPKPKKPEITVYGENEEEPKKYEPVKTKIYQNFYDVDELTKEEKEFEKAEEYIKSQIERVNEYNKEENKEPENKKPEMPGLKIITKKTYKGGKKKTKMNKVVKRAPLPFRFVASKTGKNFHDAKCLAVRKIKPKMRVWFKTKSSAKTKGFKPCPICLP